MLALQNGPSHPHTCVNGQQNQLYQKGLWTVRTWMGTCILQEMGRLHRSRASQLDTKRRKFSKQVKNLTRNKNLSFSLRCIRHSHSKGLARSCNITPNKATLAWEAFSFEDDQGQGSLTREVSHLLGFRLPWDDSSTLYPFTSLLMWFAFPGLQGVGERVKAQASPLTCMYVTFSSCLSNCLCEVLLVTQTSQTENAHSLLSGLEPSHDPKLLVVWGSPPNSFFFPTIQSTHLPTNDIHPIPHHLLPVGPLHLSPGWGPGPPSFPFCSALLPCSLCAVPRAVWLKHYLDLTSSLKIQQWLCSFLQFCCCLQTLESRKSRNQNLEKPPNLMQQSPNPQRNM